MAQVATMQPEVKPVEKILVQIVLAFRTAGWVWLLLLVIGVLFTDEAVDKRVAVATAIVTGSWTIFTFWVAKDYDKLRSLWFVSLDGLLAVGALAASYASGSESNFYGGYPISWIAVVAFAGTVWWSIGAGVFLFAAQVIGMTFIGSRTLTDKLGAVVFLIYGIIVGYAFDIIRDRDQLRAAAEAELADERAKQVRNEEQTRLATQLHDSVLQTLTAIQSAAEDSEQVAHLARRQIRELRNTIRAMQSPFEDSFQVAMFAAAGDIEDLYNIEIDVVCAFDEEMTPQLKAIVDATREAMVNAAKHSGTKNVDVYCGMEGGALEVYVRDRGRGFDPDDPTGDPAGGPPEDHGPKRPVGGFGLKNSINRRITEVGGSTSITSSPGMGTEVHISVVLP